MNFISFIASFYVENTDFTWSGYLRYRVVFVLLEKLGLGQLPGDIVLIGENSTFHFPNIYLPSYQHNFTDFCTDNKFICNEVKLK